MRIQASFESAYPHYAQASTGGASHPAFAVVNEAAGQVQPNARQQFGDALVDKFGNVFCYVRAAQALSAGNVVRRSAPGTGDHPAAGTISANTTTRVVYTNITTTVDESAIGSFLVGSSGTTPFYRRIKSPFTVGANSIFTISKVQVFFGIGKYDGDELSATPTTSDPVVIARPYNVCVGGAAAAGMVPVGVALGTVSQGSGTLIQVQGIALVNVNGTTVDVTAGGLLTTGASGTAVGPTATPTAYEVACLIGTAIAAQPDDANKLVPVALNCLNKL